MNYESNANTLTDRISALMPIHPEIMEMESPWDLFGIPEFKCDDLDPTMFQASWALAKAQQRERTNG